MAIDVLAAFPGWKTGSTKWSNLRRVSNRISLVLIAILVFEVNSDEALEPLAAIAWFTVLWSLAFFLFAVASVIYLGGSETRFDPAPFRLIFDVIVSGAMSIMAFSLAYRSFGLIDTLAPCLPSTRCIEATKLDHVYFAVVSFSTLGYGDFRIEENGRMIAAMQAIVGNLHLGLLAGAVFYALQRGTRGGTPLDSRNDRDCDQDGTDRAQGDHAHENPVVDVE